ncbi:MAG: hypothetical protein IPM76_24315 [Chloroflexi bacterium]|nr:hypothetical protein [Chloroflexota bacterium]
MRQMGLLDEPAWATVGTSRRDHDEPPGVPVRINGTWLNLLNARRAEPYVRMSDVPPAEREQAKTRVAAYAATKFQGMALTTAVTDDNRVITRTPHGNLFGYVQRTTNWRPSATTIGASSGNGRGRERWRCSCVS